MAASIKVARIPAAMDPNLDALNVPSSLTQRRSGTSLLPFELPPPSSLNFNPVLSTQKYPPLAGITVPSLVSQLLTPPSSTYTASTSDGRSSTTSASIPVLPYTPTLFWTGNSREALSQPYLPPLMRSMFSPLGGLPLYNYSSNSPVLSPPPSDLEAPPQRSSKSFRSPKRDRLDSEEDIDQPPDSLAEHSLPSPQSAPKGNLGDSGPFIRPPPPSYSLPGMPGPLLSNMYGPGAQMTMMGNMQAKMLPMAFSSDYAANPQALYGPQRTDTPQQPPAHDRPFKCDQCPQSFNRNHDLTRHKRIHLAVKPFPCNHCDKSFSRKDALKRHILVKGCGSLPGEAYESYDSTERISTSHIINSSSRTSSNLGKTTRHHHDPEDRPSPQLAGFTREKQGSLETVGAPSPPTACDSIANPPPRTPAFNDDGYLSQGRSVDTKIEDWLVESTIANTTARSASSPSPASNFTATTPSQRSLSLVNSTPKTSDSPWFGSDGERSFVQSEDTILTTWSVSSAAAVTSLAGRFVTDYLAETDAPIDGAHNSAQTMPASNGSSRTNASENCSNRNSSGSGSTAASKRAYCNDEEGEGSQRSKRPKLPDQPPEEPNTKLLACPYTKFDPQRYSERNPTEKNYRGCSSCFLKDMNRLKQHLYRVHRRPEYYCSFCFSLFNSGDALDSHIVERSCERQPSPFDEKMTSDQFKAIKRREMGKSTKDAWFDMYKILFPASPLPLDPYAESVHANSVQDFVAFFEREAPRVLASEINVRLFGSAMVTAEHEQFVDSVLAESISVLLQRLNERFGGHEPPSLGLVELPVLVR